MTRNLITGKDEPAPLATCPLDNEPLVLTFDRPKYEFVCVACGAWYGFLGPKPAKATPKRLAQHTANVATYAASPWRHVG